MNVASASLEEYLALRRADVEAALDAYLLRAPACPEIIDRAMRYSLLGGGKRIRPVLTLATADAVDAAGAASSRRLTSAVGASIRARPGEPPPPHPLALPAACAIEMIHTYSLIHDDLPAMDNDSLRRGRPTSHVVFGDGMAILAGDGLLTEAFSLLAREPATDANDVDLTNRKVRTIAIVASAAGAAGMVGGQAIDLPTPALDANGLHDLHARKTGALIRAAATVGAIMAGASDAIIHAVDGYARELGLAFQIVDDVLDVEGGVDQLGKTAGKDAAAGKTTFPALFGLDASRRMAGECIERAHERVRAAASDAFAPQRLIEIADLVLRRQS